MRPCDSDVYLNEDLAIAARGVYGVLRSLSKENKVVVSLKELMSITGLSKNTLLQSLSKLRKFNCAVQTGQEKDKRFYDLILSEKNENGSVQILTTEAKGCGQYLNTKIDGSDQNLNSGETEVRQESLFGSGRTEGKKLGKGKAGVPKEDEFYQSRVKVIDHLNQKTNKHFTYGRKETVNYLNKVFCEGFSVDDFIKVIDNKVSSWLNDPVNDKYLNPSTLFRLEKFELYVNEKTAELRTDSKDKSQVGNAKLSKYEKFYL